MITSAPHFLYPPFRTATGNSAWAIDASGEKIAQIIQLPPEIAGAAIRKIAIRLATVTTGQTLRVSLQDLSSANPDGTMDQSGTVSVADTDDNVWKQVTLDADRTVVAGASLAVVTEFDSTVGNLQVNTANAGDVATVYADHFTGSWSRTARSAMLAIEMSDGSYPYIPGVIPALPAGSGGSATVERVNRIVIPAPLRVIGVRYIGGSAGTPMAVLYDGSASSPTLLASGTMTAANIAGSGILTQEVFFSAAYDLAAGTYHYGLRPDGTNNLSPVTNTAYSNAAFAQMGGGSGCYEAVRTNATGAWTYTDTRRWSIHLICTGIDAGGGGGSLIGGRLVRA